MKQDISELYAAETARCVALISGNRAELDRLLAPRYEHVHGSGRVESRESFLESVGDLGIESIEHGDVSVRELGSAALMSGRLTMTKVTDVGPRALDLQFLAVWSHEGPGWRLEYWQNTKRRD